MVEARIDQLEADDGHLERGGDLVVSLPFGAETVARQDD